MVFLKMLPLATINAVLKGRQKKKKSHALHWFLKVLYLLDFVIFCMQLETFALNYIARSVPMITQTVNMQMSTCWTQNVPCIRKVAVPNQRLSLE